MLSYLIRRLLVTIPTLVVISFISFALIILPPGDVLSTHIQRQIAIAGDVSPEVLASVQALRVQYGLDQPIPVQYGKWVHGILTRGDFGHSFITLRNVSEFIWPLMGNTLILIGSSLVFIFVFALPVGFYSAVKQYAVGDYFFTFIAFLGVAVPGFLVALLTMYLSYRWTGTIMTGMNSPELIDAPWSVPKFFDMLKHIAVPTIVVAASSTASAVRIVRSNLLDELNKPYVMMARAKGLNEFGLLVKYPLRIAINPFLSTVAFLIPNLFASTIIVSLVLSLPTVGPIYLDALLSQDMYLAGSIVLLIAVATVTGTFISDILLSLADPRIRLGER